MKHASAIKQLLLASILFSGCAHQAENHEEQQMRIATLSNQMQTTSPQASKQSINRFATTAVTTSAHLREQYHVDLSPWLHNIAVNSGTKPRGLCFHYARDLAKALQPIAAPEWQLYFVQVHPDGILEHNAIVVAATGKPWRSGIVLDGWRNSGLLYFGPVTKDKYDWQLKQPHHSPETTTSDHPES